MESLDDLKADKRTSIRHGENIVKTTRGKPEGWKEEILGAVAGVHDCHVIYINEWEKVGKGRWVRHSKLIGFGHDVEAASYETAFLINEVTRLAQAYADVMWAQIRQIEREFGITHQQAESQFTRATGRHPLKAKLNFLKGATTAVVEKLWFEKRRRDQEARAANPYAIVLQKRKEVLDTYYAERRGVSVEEYRRQEEEAQKAASEFALKRQAELKANPPKPETAKERKAREAREHRQNEQWRRRSQKEWANRDHAAFNSGYEQGSKVTTRKGINEGPDQDRLA